MKSSQEPGVMDVQRPRPNSAPVDLTSPLDNPMAPADNIAAASPQPVPEVTEKKNRKAVIVAIVTTLVVILIVAGVAAFIIYQNSQKPAPAPATTQSENERVGVEDIDATMADIDQTLNTLNDSTDITPNDISDASLGL